MYSSDWQVGFHTEPILFDFLLDDFVWIANRRPYRRRVFCASGAAVRRYDGLYVVDGDHLHQRCTLLPGLGGCTVDLLGCDAEEVVPASAKTGLGIGEILEAIIERVPAPKGNPDEALQALIFDSVYNPFRGVKRTLE